VLADRMAANFAHYQPGWRLPRPSELARRFSVSTGEVDAAIEELTSRSLLHRLPDGQLYRASPSEYLITLDGLPCLGSRIDPMGASIACISSSLLWRTIPENVARLLGLAPREQAGVIRTRWTADGRRAAMSTTYLAHDLYPAPADGQPAPTVIDSVLNSPAAFSATSQSAVLPVAVQLELQPPPPSIARSLELGPGQPAILVTVTFSDPSYESTVALTYAVLRSDLFRIVIESPVPAAPETTSDDPASMIGSWEQ
jgi:DNA-binding GntR family transcriptional regulator